MAKQGLGQSNQNIVIFVFSPKFALRHIVSKVIVKIGIKITRCNRPMHTFTSVKPIRTF